jgi:hypothetical protein
MTRTLLAFGAATAAAVGCSDIYGQTSASYGFFIPGATYDSDAGSEGGAHPDAGSQDSGGSIVDAPANPADARLDDDGGGRAADGSVE